MREHYNSNRCKCPDSQLVRWLMGMHQQQQATDLIIWGVEEPNCYLRMSKLIALSLWYSILLLWASNVIMAHFRTPISKINSFYLGMIFLQLEQPLEQSVSAGNNKAALFQLLGRLGGCIQRDGLIFWGVDRRRHILCIAIRSHVSPAFDLNLPALVKETMGNVVKCLPEAMHTCQIPSGVLNQHTLKVDNRECRQLLTTVLSNDAGVPGAWLAVPYDGIRAVNEGGLSLVRYRVKPGTVVSLDVDKTPRRTSTSPSASQESNESVAAAERLVATDAFQDGVKIDDSDWIKV